MTSDLAAPLTQLAFAHPWRTYQRLMLARVEQLDEATLHLVAPPGSGKTIVGIELIRRRGHPAVVLAPTSTIQGQWIDEVGMFTDDQHLVRAATSSDPSAPAAINVFTYQLLSVQDELSRELLDRAEEHWRGQLVEDGVVETPQQAAERVATMAANHPANHSREVSRRARRLRKQLIRGGEPVERFLHPNAVSLLARLVDAGVRTVVLDECHHLLDHWALVVRALVDRIAHTHGEPATVIGLTATLPDPEDPIHHDNYTGLLGDVDFEVPTPAVVKEGDLAPWRDLVWFVEPTPAEQRFLRRADDALVRVLARVLDPERVTGWVTTDLFGPDRDGRRDHLAQRLRDAPLLAVAQTRWLVERGGDWPAGVPVPRESREELTFDDRLALAERFALDVLALSDDPDDHDTLELLRAALQGFGMTVTERGLRQGRSAGDLVLALSAAKDDAVVEILRLEAEDLGGRLRAVVVTDFAEASSAVRRAGDALAPDAGSAHRVFHALIADPATDALDPMLVTGSSVLVDADHGDQLVAALNEQLAVDRLRAECRYRNTDHPRVREIVGTGPDWSPATYVRLLTKVFESGATRCLVGTRGIFGEGWDALTLNTLLDLTAVTTSTGVQQLRGRSIRLDPAWPRKVSHNWDVVCVAPDHPRGDADLRRLVRRHARTWGVVPPAGSWQDTLATGVALADAAMSGTGAHELTGAVGDVTGQVVRGIGHVSRLLERDLAWTPFKRVRFDRHTQRSMRAIGRRDGSYALWGVGEAYDNFETRATELDVRDLRIRTVHTIRDTLRQLFARLGAIVTGGALIGAYLGFRVGDLTLGALAGFVAFLAVGVANRPTLRRLRDLFVEQPPDAILRDVGVALLVALQETYLISKDLQPEEVRVHAREDLAYEVTLQHAEPDDAATFIEAFRQTLGPVGDPRYLIRRTDARLPSLPLTALWLPLRTLVYGRIGRPSHHPVPDVLAVNREHADAYAAAWRRYVGGGRLVYTRSDEGRRILLEARAEPERSARSVAFDRWR